LDAAASDALNARWRLALSPVIWTLRVLLATLDPLVR
jgi:hypothetical protein